MNQPSRTNVLFATFIRPKKTKQAFKRIQFNYLATSVPGICACLKWHRFPHGPNLFTPILFLFIHGQNTLLLLWIRYQSRCQKRAYRASCKKSFNQIKMHRWLVESYPCYRNRRYLLVTVWLLEITTTASQREGAAYETFDGDFCVGWCDCHFTLM